MVRPREFDLDTVSEALMNAFWLNGYARTSIPELTAGTGLLPGSLYAAFGSKEDMFVVALTRYLTQLRAAIVAAPAGVDGIRHMLDTVAKLTVADPKRRGCLLLNTIPEAGALSMQTRAGLEQGLGEMRAFIRDRLHEAQGSTRASAKLEKVGALVFAASVSIRVLGRAGVDAKLLQDIADGAVAAVRQTLAKR